MLSGSLGNIPAKAIDEACCAVSVLAVNLTPFSGGQDERDFQTVAKQDVANASQPLKTTVTQSMQAALLGQIKPTEQLSILPCTPTVSSDHQPGQEARQVHVTVSETCNAIAYSTQTLTEKATALLSSQAVKQLGNGYSLMGSVQVSVTQASVTHSPTPLVFLTFQAQGRWVYALTQQTQLHIKQLIAGKTKPEASQILKSQPGIERAAIRFEGFGDNSVSTQKQHIHTYHFVRHVARLSVGKPKG